MSAKLPPDFDPDWYAATYPDVGMSGLDPREHYRRFGKILGRPTRGASRPKPQPEAQVQAERVTPAAAAIAPAPSIQPEPAVAPAKAAAPAAPPAKTKAKPKAKAPSKSAIIDLPKGFDPSEAVPLPAPPKTGGGAGGVFTLESIASSGAGSSAGSGALEGYRRLLRLDGGDSGASGSAVFCASAIVQAGATRIDNAWLVGGSTLRLLIAGAQGSDGGVGWMVRAFQAEPAAPGHLKMLGRGIQLPPAGPVLFEIDLAHPLMPILLEYADGQGATKAIALLPFPSLLPGGLHHAELKALQTQPNPMDDFWTYSDALLAESIGGEGWPERMVARIAVESSATFPSVLTPTVRQWLTMLFEVTVEDAGSGRPEARQLLLPADCVPTIGALVSRRAAGKSGAVAGHYLVAEMESHRPRWSIALPAGDDFGGAVPKLRTGKSGSKIERSPVPLAIALLKSTPPSAEVSTTHTCAVGPEPLTIVVQASEGAKAERLIRSIRSGAKGELEWLVRLNGSDGGIQAALDGACDGAGWTSVGETDLRQIASGARHHTLITIDDRIVLDGIHELAAILELLGHDESTGSASCALLSEKIVKKQAVLQPASGGLFPTGVSFVSGPRLAFGEPDVAQALPNLSYPVIANTLLLTAWRRSALAQLPSVRGMGSAASEDIRIGLDLMRAGYRNWCTTTVAARLTGPYVPRDGIDPVGPGYVQPEAWQDILEKVAVVRELF